MDAHAPAATVDVHALHESVSTPRQRLSLQASRSSGSLSEADESAHNQVVARSAQGDVFYLFNHQVRLKHSYVTDIHYLTERVRMEWSAGRRTQAVPAHSGRPSVQARDSARAPVLPSSRSAVPAAQAVRAAVRRCRDCRAHVPGTVVRCSEQRQRRVVDREFPECRRSLAARRGPQESCEERVRKGVAPSERAREEAAAVEARRRAPEQQHECVARWLQRQALAQGAHEAQGRDRALEQHRAAQRYPSLPPVPACVCAMSTVLSVLDHWLCTLPRARRPHAALRASVRLGHQDGHAAARRRRDASESAEPHCQVPGHDVGDARTAHLRHASVQPGRRAVHALGQALGPEAHGRRHGASARDGAS